jgi:hypothetical protein
MTILYQFDHFQMAVLGGSKIQRCQLLCWHPGVIAGLSILHGPKGNMQRQVGNIMLNCEGKYYCIAMKGTAWGRWGRIQAHQHMHTPRQTDKHTGSCSYKPKTVAHDYYAFVTLYILIVHMYFILRMRDQDHVQ